jgi:hypothetical protein
VKKVHVIEAGEQLVGEADNDEASADFKSLKEDGSLGSHSSKA